MRTLSTILLWIGGIGSLGVIAGKAAEPMEEWRGLKPMQPRGYVAGKVGTPVKIDGRLDDAAWTSAPWTEDFEDIEGPIRPKPQFRTRAKMIWDEEYLYIGAELLEPHVWGTLKEHDAVIFQDNDFEVFIEPDGDNHDYYEFEMNALNTTWDLLLVKPYKDGGPALNELELEGTKTAVHVDGTLNDPRDVDKGWSLEIAFPWKTLKQKTAQACPPKDGDLWRISFSRVEWQVHVVGGKYEKVAGQKEANWVWSPQGIIDMHRPERWGMVRFVSKPPGVGEFKPDPALAVKDTLHEIYYRQRGFHAKHGRFTDSLQDLGIAVGELKGIEGRPVIVLEKNGWEAKVTRAGGEGGKEVWRIRQDAKVWKSGK